jgi:hypothetical protein
MTRKHSGFLLFTGAGIIVFSLIYTGLMACEAVEVLRRLAHLLLGMG